MTLAPVSSLTFQPACHLPAGERDRAQPLLDPPLGRLATSHTTMKTAIAISPMMTNVLSVAKIPPAIVTTSQMARIAPRIVPMTRPMSPVCLAFLAGDSRVGAGRAVGPPGMPGRTAPGHRRSQPGRRRGTW